jgi:glutathione S-transferase
VLPALEFADGKVVTQSPAIAELLEEIYPATNLLNGDAFNRAMVG